MGWSVERLPKVSNFCWCFSLKIGALILGVMSVWMNFYVFSISLWLVMMKHKHPDYDGFMAYQNLPFGPYWSFVSALIGVLINLFLLLGVFVSSSKFLLPLIWIGGGMIVVGIGCVPWFLWNLHIQYGLVLLTEIGKLFDQSSINFVCPSFFVCLKTFFQPSDAFGFHNYKFI